MNYQAALDYLLSFADYERAPWSALIFDLRRVQLLLEKLGNPEGTARSIHIAGTSILLQLRQQQGRDDRE